MDKVKNNSKSITTYQLFRREFIEPKNIYLEWTFTYLLKCFYFPKYFRPEYLKWTENHAGKALWEKLTGGKFNKEEQLIFTNPEKEKEWEKISNASRDFLIGDISREFIKYALTFTPHKNKDFNIPTDEQVEQLYRTFQKIPDDWKEKQPWYPYSTCDLVLDDCLITIRWDGETKINQRKKIEELATNYFDYDFPPIKKFGLYFASQGKLSTTKIWGECPNTIPIKVFQENASRKHDDWRNREEKSLRLKNKEIPIFIPEKPNLKNPLELNYLVSLPFTKMRSISYKF